jgi:hypothetical protein
LDSVVLVVDLTSVTGLENSLKYLELVKSSLPLPVPENRKVGVLIGNKMDLGNRRGMSSKSVEDFAADHNLEYFECSAVSPKSMHLS